MPFAQTSDEALLATCHPDIQKVVRAVADSYPRPLNIIEGHRSPARQQLLVSQGKSRTMDSRHLAMPSLAIDMAPSGKGGTIDWNARDDFHLFAGFVLGVARGLGVDLRWGGDWDRDADTKDNGFDDLVHFELPARP